MDVDSPRSVDESDFGSMGSFVVSDSEEGVGSSVPQDEPGELVRPSLFCSLRKFRL